MNEHSISPRETKILINKLKNNKAPGEDRINNRLIKNIPRKALVFLTYLFNECLKRSYFPNCWKNAEVIALPKPGKDISLPENYRPISLLCALSKILERLIHRRLEKTCNLLNVIPDDQFGFRKGHSTTHQLARVKSYIKSKLRNKESIGMVVLDIQKGFDSVWHVGLIHKMGYYGFPDYLSKLINSYLTDRTFKVKVGSSLSSKFNIKAGVPQGAVLSPLSYNLYTADIVNVNHDCELAMFADDTAIYAADKDVDVVLQNLQSTLNNVSDYFKLWNITINSDKTQAIYFSMRRAERFLPTNKFVTLNNQQVIWKKEIKYLGLLLDTKLTFSKHIEDKVVKTENIVRVLYPLLSKRSKLSVKNKMTIFKVIILPMMLYAAPVWLKCAQTHKKKLQIRQNMDKRFLSIVSIIKEDSLNGTLNSLERFTIVVSRLCANNHQTKRNPKPIN